MGEKEENEIQATLVVAGLLRNPATREIGLVDRKKKLTLPTGHMNPNEDNTPEEALIREMKEEFPELEDLEIIQSLGTVVRNKSSPPISIEIFSCNIRGTIAFYTEGSFVAWIRPPEALKLPYLDILAKEALKRYVKKYPGIKKEE